MKGLLINEPPIQVLPSLALAIGLNEAMVLQQLHYWLGNPKTGIEKNGHKWVFNTYEEWQENFPFWSTRTIQRIFASLEQTKLVISEQFDKARYDHRKYYRIDYDALDLLLVPPKVTESDDQEVQTGVNDHDNLSSSDHDKLARSLNDSETPETTTYIRSASSTRRTDAPSLGDGVDCMLNAARAPESIRSEALIQDFPPEVQDTLRTIIRLWKWPASSIPARPERDGKGGMYATWINELHEINDLISGHGQAVLQKAYGIWNEKPFTVSRPGSLRSVVLTAVGIENNRKSETPTYQPPSWLTEFTPRKPAPRPACLEPRKP